MQTKSINTIGGSLDFKCFMQNSNFDLKMTVTYAEIKTALTF
jgi:hypothetical protein